MEDESDEENDEEDALVAMDITETIDPLRISPPRVSLLSEFGFFYFINNTLIK